MWDSTKSSSTASSSDNKQNIQKVIDDCKCSGVEQFEQQYQQQQKNNSKYPQQTSIIGAQSKIGSSSSSEQKEIDLAGGNSDSGFISGEQTTSELISESEEQIQKQQQQEEGAVGFGGGGGGVNIRKLNIPGSLSEPQLQQQQQQFQQFSYQKEQQQQQLDNLDSGCQDLDSGEQPNCPTDSGCIEDTEDMKFKHNVDAAFNERFCKLSVQNHPNNDLSLTNTSTTSSSSAASMGLNIYDASKLQQQQQSQRLSQQKSSSTSYTDGHQKLPETPTPQMAWEKFFQQNEDGDTALHLACISGSERVVAALIRMAPHPCLFNIQNDEAQTALHLATITVQPKIIRMLLIAGAEPTVRDRHGNTALHLACISGQVQCVQALTIPFSASEVHEAHRSLGHRANDNSYLSFAELPVGLEIRNYDGERCVHLAAQAGFKQILHILVTYGADINAREGKSGRTPLHIAIESCNEELIAYLLEYCQKLNLETATYAGLTAFQVACILNRSEMQKLLVNKGAEPLSPPESDYDSDTETDLDDSKYRWSFFGYNGLAMA